MKSKDTSSVKIAETQQNTSSNNVDNVGTNVTNGAPGAPKTHRKISVRKRDGTIVPFDKKKIVHILQA